MSEEERRRIRFAQGATESETEIEGHRDANTITLGKALSLTTGVSVTFGGDGDSVPEELGRYRIERELGRGGMGTVYLAHDQQLGRKVALKIPSFSEKDGREIVARFHREARAMATVQHANLCQIYDVGQFEKWHFLTMAYIDGQTLSSKLEEAGPLTVIQAMTLLKKLATAIQKVHEAGVVHRDLKSANIMLTQDLEPIVMDFGVARLQQADETELTRSGALVGSPEYMAPEQVEARHQDVGPATDVYALGVILYQMLTGRKPFEGSIASIFAQIVSRTPEPPSKLRGDLPLEVDAICLKAMSKLPSQRHASAKELAGDLSKVLAGPGAILPVVDVRAGRDAAPAPEYYRETSVGNRSGSHGEAELRHVTVAVFAYEAESSAISGGVGSSAELLHEQAQMFTSFVTERITRLGGVRVLSLGDEVIACFGYPQTFEDAPQRAVRAALQVMHDLADTKIASWGETGTLGTRRSATLPSATQAQVTIHSGEGVIETAHDVRNAGFSLIGDVRNMVIRLSAIAQPGAITLSAATHQRVALYFECESRGVQRVRGAALPVELFGVIREAASRNRVELVDPGNLTPLVGRDTELTILKDRWEQALDELGQIVLLIGDAGLGKSRLIRELRDYVIGEDPEGAAVIELRCSPYHQNAPFFPLVEFLWQLLRLEHCSASERLRVIIRYLGEFKLESGDNIALFCRMLGVPVDDRFPPPALPPQKLKERTEELLLSWLKQMVAISPVLFIVEDLHWIDPSSISLIERHVEQFESGRTLTLLTFRPEFETPWKSKPHQTQIALNRLTKRQVGEMMRKRTKRTEIPELILQQVISRTDGIPLFIEEFSSVIVEAGILDRTGTDAASLLNVIPATLHDLLLARLDRMNADREIIQAAATIGREFSFELLAASCALSEADLGRQLDKLVKAEILFRRGHGRGASYIFKHALLQDAAYRSMLTKKRQMWHQRIAEVLEARFGEIAAGQPALLAQHFTEAGLSDKAIEYWLKAGKKSQSGSAVPEAIEQLSRGLEIVRALPASSHRDELELQYQMPLGGVLVQAKGYGASEPGAVFARARELCELLGQQQALGIVTAGLWGWTLVRAEYPEALQLAEALARLGDELGDPGLRGEACWAMTCTLFYMGRFAEASEQAWRGIVIHDAAPDCWRPFAAVTGQSAVVCERAYLALSLFCLGEVEAALSQSRDAVALARRIKDPFSLAMALYHGAWLRLWSSLADELQALSEEGLTLCRELSFHFYAVTQQFNVAAIPLLSPTATAHQLEAFVTTLHVALAAHLDAGSGVFLSKMYWLAADALRRLGRLGEAQVALDKGFQHQTRSGERFCDAELHRLQAEIHFARRDTAAASQSLETALQIATAQQARTWIARAKETQGWT